MAHIVIIGGGVSGCAAARELAERGQRVTILEKSARIGGNAREYGCKASASCNNCGVCLTGDLWDAVENNASIELLTETSLVDVSGSKGDFCVVYDGPQGRDSLPGVAAVIVAVGFERATGESFASLEFMESGSVISGFELEKRMLGRTREGVMPESISSIAFLQCFGSRDVQEKAFYCSKVCCAYSTRSAKALKYINPDIRITFFHMDLQFVNQAKYYDELRREGIEFIKTRPIKIRSGKSAAVVYEDPETGVVTEREFDLVVLSEGIHPPRDAEKLAELCMLGIDDKGFLRCVRDGDKTGIYLAGCASGPKRIEESYSEGVATADRLLADLGLPGAGQKGESAI
jgi:heterodisulfide reductase subunit A